jgi:predicted DNA-binding transcriptional regulator AlpA
MLGISHTTLRVLVRAGDIPKPVTLPGGSHRYLASEIEAVLQRLIEARNSGNTEHAESAAGVLGE